ncbi:hypothetical protein SLS55_009493 [Diplodia seriata]|uniref:SH3 domain-containing protein n=1 Tax=Diplodia seriata TaxID=420778 RepID=A0ABR3C2V5_9PEZI
MAGAGKRYAALQSQAAGNKPRSVPGSEPASPPREPTTGSNENGPNQSEYVWHGCKPFTLKKGKEWKPQDGPNFPPKKSQRQLDSQNKEGIMNPAASQQDSQGRVWASVSVDSSSWGWAPMDLIDVNQGRVATVSDNGKPFVVTRTGSFLGSSFIKGKLGLVSKLTDPHRGDVLQVSLVKHDGGLTPEMSAPVDILEVYRGHYGKRSEIGKTFVITYDFTFNLEPVGLIPTSGFPKIEDRISVTKGQTGKILALLAIKQWCKVEVDGGNTGYVPANCLRVGYPDDKLAPFNILGQPGYIKESYLNPSLRENDPAVQLLSIEQGSQVLVHKVEDSQAYVFVSTLDDPTRFGHVPFGILAPGWNRGKLTADEDKYKLCRVLGGFTPQRIWTPIGNPFPKNQMRCSSGEIGQIIDVEAFGRRWAKLTNPMPLEALIATHDLRQTFAVKVIDAMKKANVFEVFDGVQFTLGDLARVGSNRDGQAERHKDPGYAVYLILYPGTPGGLSYAYTGQTKAYVSRDYEHVYALTKPNNQRYDGYHYRTARTTDLSRRRFIIVCSLPGSNMGVRHITEQLITCLCGTYPDFMLSENPDLHDQDMSVIQNYDDEIEVEEGDEPDVGADTGQDSTTSTVIPWKIENHQARAAAHRKCAQEIMTMSDQVFAREGWLNEKKHWDGLNISSPLYEALVKGEGSIWVRQETDDYYVFRKPASALNARRYIIFSLYGPKVGGGTEDYVNCKSRQSPPEMKVGQAYYLVVEIKKHGRHPKPYALLPDLGLWQDWAEAKRLGIRFEYENEAGQWRTHYMQDACDPMTKVLSTFGRNNVPPIPGSVQIYAESMALINFFMRRTMATQYRPVWWPHLGTGENVIAYQYNHMQQTWTLNNIPETFIGHGPIAKTWESLKQELHAAGAERIDLAWSERPMRKSGRNSIWVQYCDFCYLNHLLVNRMAVNDLDGFEMLVRPAWSGISQSAGSTDQRLTCERFGQTSQCKNCRDMGIPCSYTIDWDKLKHNVKLQKLLMAQSFIHGNVNRPAGPQRKGPPPSIDVVGEPVAAPNLLKDICDHHVDIIG